jgi:hypothetical protein
MLDEVENPTQGVWRLMYSYWRSSQSMDRLEAQCLECTLQGVNVRVDALPSGQPIPRGLIRESMMPACLFARLR